VDIYLVYNGSTMGQVTLYLDTETEERVKQAAKAAGLSQSRWVANLIREKTTTEWPSWVVELVGSWPDLPSLEEIRKGLPEDLPREPL
jgi:hypothetical protein